MFCDGDGVFNSGSAVSVGVAAESLSEPAPSRAVLRLCARVLLSPVALAAPPVKAVASELGPAAEASREPSIGVPSGELMGEGAVSGPM